MYLTLHNFSLKLCSATIDLKHSAVEEILELLVGHFLRDLGEAAQVPAESCLRGLGL